MSQNDRIAIVENTVDSWDDRIVSLETVNIDVQNRLDDLEETILSEKEEFYCSLLLVIFITVWLMIYHRFHRIIGSLLI